MSPMSLMLSVRAKLGLLATFCIIATLAHGTTGFPGDHDGDGRELASFDCDAGCDTKYKPVCGVDGIVYANKCLAFCQGIEVLYKGVCSEEDGGSNGLTAAAAPARYRQDGKVSVKTMKRFDAEGFTFQSYQSLSAAAPEGSPVQSSIPVLDKFPDPPTATEMKNVQAVRITAEGHVYKKNAAKMAALMSGGGGPTQALGAAATVDVNGTAIGGRRLRGDDGRDLTVFGVDNRFAANNTVAPYNRVGHLLFSFRGKQSMCSAAVISLNAILTAGHCASVRGAWGTNFKFYPGQQGSSYPYGKWGRWSYVTTFSDWVYYNDHTWDMAVINYYGDLSTGYNLGNYLGYFGYSIGCGWPTVTTTGYPADRNGGNEEDTQSSCVSVSKSCTPGDETFEIARSNCDIFPGQSGSPVYAGPGPVYTIFGVVSFQVCENYCTNYQADNTYPGSYNGFCAMTNSKFSSIQSWANPTTAPGLVCNARCTKKVNGYCTGTVCGSTCSTTCCNGYTYRAPDYVCL